MSANGGLMRDPGGTGRYGEFGGRFVPESLVPACQELEAGFASAWADPAFHARLGDEAALAHALGQERLAEDVVDLVRACVRQVLAL